MDDVENNQQETVEQRAEEQQTSSEVEKKDTKDSSIGSSKIKRRRERKFPVKLIAIVLGLVLVVGGAGWFLLKEPLMEDEMNGDSTLEAPEFKQPTSTPTPVKQEVERSQVTIQVLNGTGIEREATYLKEQLEGLGYEKIEVDNAKNQDNEVTQVTFASTLDEQVIDEITEELKKIYKNVETDMSTASEDFDVSVITGLRKGQTFPTDSPEPSPTSGVDETPTPTSSPSATPTP